MTKIIEKKSVEKALDDVPNRICEKYDTQKDRLEKDRHDPHLHTKKLKGLD